MSFIPISLAYNFRIGQIYEYKYLHDVVFITYRFFDEQPSMGRSSAPLRPFIRPLNTLVANDSRTLTGDRIFFHAVFHEMQ